MRQDNQFILVHPTTNIKPKAPEFRRAKLAAFALVEVILAIGIATGLLLVALVFYHQAADLRSQILKESEGYSEMRLTLDRLAGDLRTAQPHASAGGEFVGDSTSLRFTRAALSAPVLDVSLAGRGLKTDLARISLFTMMETNGDKLMITGLNRLEEPFPAGISSPTDTGSIYSDASSLADTNYVAETLMDSVRFVRFRYWNGAAWQAAWSNSVPPPGVEIVLADEPLPPEAAPEDYPPNPFRRVVALPGGIATPTQDTAPAESPVSQ